MAEHKPNMKLTKDTPFLNLMGELCGVFCEDLEEIDHVITAPHCIKQQRIDTAENHLINAGLVSQTGGMEYHW